jgi:hypothetical protein
MLVFKAGASTLPHLLIVVASDLSHIAIPIEHASSGEGQFSLNIAYDTYTGCNGTLDFCRYPTQQTFPPFAPGHLLLTSHQFNVAQLDKYHRFYTQLVQSLAGMKAGTQC